MFSLKSRLHASPGLRSSRVTVSPFARLSLATLSLGFDKNVCPEVCPAFGLHQLASLTGSCGEAHLREKFHPRRG